MKFWKKLSKLNVWTKWIVGVIFALIIVALGFWWTNSGNNTSQTVAVTRGDVTQKVLVSGKVEAAQKVELSFESGGKVSQIVKQAGEQVKTGELIASLNTAELGVKLARQQAALEQEKIALNNIVNPPAKDRLASENEVEQNKEALTQAQSDSVNVLNEALVDLPTILNKLDELTTAGNGYLSDNDIRRVGARAKDYKTQAEQSYWSAQKSYDLVKKNPELKTVYQTAKLTSTAVKDSYTLIIYLEDQSDTVAASAELIADKSTLSTYTTTINGHLAALLAALNDLDKTARDVTESEENRRDLLSGTASTDAATQQLKVRQAELDVQDTRVQISKQQIRAPFDGMVARNDLELGETVKVGDALVFLISENQYEVVAKVPEAEVTKIAIGDVAKVALDAFSPSEPPLEAKVVSIDPAEVVVDGVATYKVTLQFVNQNDKIKSGMTASLEIIGASKYDVLIISERALNIKNNNYFVRMIDDKNLVERLVTVGLRGSDGNVEIFSGLNEGEQITVGMIQ